MHIICGLLKYFSFKHQVNIKKDQFKISIIYIYIKFYILYLNIFLNNIILLISISLQEIYTIVAVFLRRVKKPPLYIAYCSVFWGPPL